MRIISANEVKETLSLEKSIELMRRAFIALSGGDAQQIIRPVLPLHGRNVLGMMPAYLASDHVAGIKLLSVFPENYSRGVPSHQGQMLIFETHTGTVKAIVDADSLTALRTAAASAAATAVLAREDAHSLAILGAGLQGRQHLLAMGMVRELRDIRVWDIYPESSKRYAEEMGALTGHTIRVCSTAAEACRGADLVCTLTPAVDPIITARDIAPGTHINAVGACSANTRELAADLMAAGRLFVDWKPATLVEAGDYLLALADGAIQDNHILGEVGQVLLDEIPGRTAADEITIFEALGQAVQDLIAANYIADLLLQ